jgi:hypothetical protein
MPLDGHVVTPTADSIRGFDANERIGPKTAAAFHKHGYRFCLRYIRRDPVNDHDLSPEEANVILQAGLALMPVQHVQSEKSWIPTPKKGTQFGKTGAGDAERIGVPPGVTVWCDLEGVKVGTPAEQVIEYCNNWHAAVAAAGYVPGLYVGFRAGMSAKQLFHDLRFTHYWGAFNLNSDEVPVVRGLQMKQKVAKPADKVPGSDVKFQVDVIRTDALGGRPALLAPEGWSP